MGRNLPSRLNEQANAYDVAVIKARVTSLARTVRASPRFIKGETFLLVSVARHTTIEGLYAAGDVVSDQIAVATGPGAIAATYIHKSLPCNFR